MAYCSNIGQLLKNNLLSFCKEERLPHSSVWCWYQIKFLVQLFPVKPQSNLPYSLHRQVWCMGFGYGDRGQHSDRIKGI